MIKNKKTYRYTIFISIIILIVFFTIWFITSFNKSYPQNARRNELVSPHDFKYNPDGTITLGLGLTAHGIYDMHSNKIYDNDTIVDLKNGKFEGQIRFQQNLEIKTNYLLIVLIDSTQHEFFSYGTAYSSYPFTLEGNDEISIDIEVNNLDSNDQVFNFLIVSEPDITNLSFDDWDTIYLTQEFFSWRLFFHNLNPEKHIKFHAYNDTIENDINYCIQLTKNHNNVTAVPTSTSGEKMELVISNTYDFDVSYAIVPFLNWEQSNFDNGSTTRYINIPAQTTVCFDFLLPKVETDSPYQVFAFPQPFNDNISRVMRPYSTLRTIIHPSE